MTPISICVIMKNEEKHMERFLTSIKKGFGAYPYELLLVDTGSTDRTIEIAEKYTQSIYHFDWIGDFSAARNYSLNLAGNNWVLILDCDEYISEINTGCFDRFIKQDPKAAGVISIRNHYDLNGNDNVRTDRLERFFDKRLFHYESIIHEQIRTLEGKDDYRRIALPITVEHQGYNGSAKELRVKVERNNELLFKMLEDNPGDPYLYFQLGQSYNIIHDDEKAAYYYGKGLEYEVDPNAEYVRTMVTGYGYNLLNLGRFEEALQFQNIYDEFAQTSDFVCLMGLIYLRNGMVEQALDEFIKATTFETSNTEGTNSFIPLYNIGCINEVIGNLDTAVDLYKKCGSFQPALDRLKVLEDRK